MLLAHGGTEGPNFEALVLAVPMVVLGIILFVQKSAKPVVSVVLVLGGVALAYGGFTFLGNSDDHDEAEAAAGADARSAALVEGLCEASDLLAEGDASGARSSFFDDAHAPLHEVADRLAAEDRAAAAALLEAKQAVEEGFGGDEFGSEGSQEPPSIESVQRDVDALIIATVQGFDRLGEEVKGCA